MSYGVRVTELSPVTLAVADLIGRRAYALGVVLGDEQLAMAARPGAVQRLASEILAGDHDSAAAALELAWPDGDPPRAWWTSPLGVAVSLATAAACVPVAHAAVVLGVTDAAVEDDLASGRLDHHRNGGVTLESLRELVRLERRDVH